MQAATRGRERQYQNRDQMESIRLAEGRAASSLQERFEAMANSIPQLAWMAKPDGWISGTTAAGTNTAARPKRRCRAGAGQSVHDPAELPRVTRKWKASLASGEPWEDTFPLRRHDGEFRWHLSRAMPFRDAPATSSSGSGRTPDITEQQRGAEERRAASWRSSGRRAGSRTRQPAEGRIPSDFEPRVENAPQRHFRLDPAFAEDQRARIPHAVAEGIDVIDRNVRLQAQLIEDLLDMSRIISGKIRLDVQPVDLPAAVNAAIESVRPTAQAKGVRLDQAIDPSAEPVNADPGRLQQVIWNLLTNAIKFTPKGGRIAVRVERIGSQMQVSVTDTGEGINPEFLPHLFERFSQADGSMRAQARRAGPGPVDREKHRRIARRHRPRGRRGRGRGPRSSSHCPRGPPTVNAATARRALRRRRRALSRRLAAAPRPEGAGRR